MNRFAITMGDCAGIGPETIVKGWPSLFEGGIVYGDPMIMQAAIDAYAPALSLDVHTNLEAIQFNSSQIPLVATSELATQPPLGQVSGVAGRASFQAIEAAIADCSAGKLAGLVTAPINKAALQAGGVDFPGHTEMLQALTGAPKVSMVLANDELAVILATVHCSMRQAIQQIEQGAVVETLAMAKQALIDMGRPEGKIAVAGLNPHAGEDGLFGHEEQHYITPAIQAAVQAGEPVSGPWPGDTVFMRARKGEFDLVVAMYHDQGLIPVKYLGVDAGVNMTVGLPFIRTSPDHGTAFDIAGLDKASPDALIYAYRYAQRIASQRSAS